jgi:uncharacterized membrane protein
MSLLGSALLSFVAIWLALAGWSHPSAPYFLGGALLYTLGLMQNAGT